MMRSIINILIAATIVTVFGCTTENWKDHYDKPPETINSNVWDAVKGRSELSDFVALVEKHKYDTLFLKNDTYTLFVPDNSAFQKLVKSQVNDTTILNYHISRHFINPVDIQGKRKLQTFAEKFSTFENINGKPTYDGIALNFQSPLYINGRFFIMSEVAVPRLNLYEYIAKNNPYLKTYIDSKDTIVIDYAKSTPIGFDKKGNTVYDTTAVKTNKFESPVYGTKDYWFPVSQEFRKWTGTIAFPKLVNYQNGLTEMAQKLGGRFQSYKDIPEKWQQQILIPYLISRGVFLNMLEPSEFKDSTVLYWRKRYSMANIRGDSITIDYKPADPYLCSNGIFYDYATFKVLPKLYSDTVRMQGERLAYTSGVNKYKWRTSTTVTSTSIFDVTNYYVKGTTAKESKETNDSVLIVTFNPGYKGVFKVQFSAPNMFPRKYRMEFRTQMDYGGIYDIYVNNVLVKTFDYYQYVLSRGGIIKSVTGANFVPVGRYNKFDCYVDILDYGKPVIRFEYKGPGNSSRNGFALDVINFIPVAN
jgi:hypothetical protein